MSQQPHPDGVRLLPWSIPDWLIDAILVSLIAAGLLARPFVDDEAFERVEWIALAVAIGLLLTRRRHPVETLAAAVVSSSVAIAVTDRPPVLLLVALSSPLRCSSSDEPQSWRERSPSHAFC